MKRLMSLFQWRYNQGEIRLMPFFEHLSQNSKLKLKT
jgi:hypothetical protein